MIEEIDRRVVEMRTTGALTPDVLNKLRRYFRIKNIYHSNAIEGNKLNVGETRLVVEQGLTITGKPLKDQAEAKNLSAALDFLEELVENPSRPITEADVRQIHFLVLKGINDIDAGQYRSSIVEISGSHYKPPAPESIPPQMREFGEWIQCASVPGNISTSENAILIACAAHTWFVTIHPFIDGNGRVARLMMNLVLMRYGYPIAIVSREDRERYYDALEISQTSDITPFVSLIAECVTESLEEYEMAAQEQREAVEWAKSLASRFDQKEKIKASNQYEVWRNAMEFLKSLFKQTTELLSTSANLSEIYFKDFGNLEFEKYLSLKNYGSAKKTWFFRLDFRSGNNAARYLFFFESLSIPMRRETDIDVSLHISREEPTGSYHYERLDDISASNVPNIMEIAYKASEEIFVVREKNNNIRSEKIDTLCRRFVQDIIEKHFGG
ncbi:Fic family protein [Candidatus Sumerlaeota bacterium]|nr:Fic family protein [Candidatus Sumerlaeota bacterium]